MQCVDFSLTYEQYLTIQHNLPKRYSLIDHKNIKRGVVITSAVKLGPEDVGMIIFRLKIFPNYQEMYKTLRKFKVELKGLE